MNKARRDQIDIAQIELELIGKVFQEQMEKLSDLKETIEGIRDDEQEAFDNLPEGLQQAERGERMERAIEKLDEIVERLGDIEKEIADSTFAEMDESLDFAANGD